MEISGAAAGLGASLFLPFLCGISAFFSEQTFMGFFVLIRLNFQSLVGVWCSWGEQELGEDHIVCLPGGLGAGDTFKVQDIA